VGEFNALYIRRIKRNLVVAPNLSNPFSFNKKDILEPPTVPEQHSPGLISHTRFGLGNQELAEFIW